MRASVNISLPEEMRQWVEEQVRSRGYATVSEFFRELLREAQKQQAREEIDRKLLAALESGKPVPVTSNDWKQLRKEAKKRLGSKSRKAK